MMGQRVPSVQHGIEGTFTKGEKMSEFTVVWRNVEVRLVPGKLEYEIGLPARLDTGRPIFTTLDRSIVRIWYQDNGFVVRRYGLSVISSGQPIPEGTSIVHATPNILIGLLEVKSSGETNQKEKEQAAVPERKAFM